ncbi:MAG: dolichyl-phosphate-mannose--protein mannosyltransferase, partial [Bacteroides sp.]
TILSLSLVGVISCILPAIWYLAAYQQGGDNFISLVMEENFGRFMGKMSYSSHENPAYYNFITVLSGYAPYTVLALVSLFFLKYTRLSGKPREWWQRFTTYIREMDNVRLFSLLSIVLIFVFYCIPKSKRSVYLLPIYPFIAYFLAEFIFYLIRNKSKAIPIYSTFMVSLGSLLSLVFIIIRCGLIPVSIFHGKHVSENIAYLNALRYSPMGWIDYVLVLLPLVIALCYFSKVLATKKSAPIMYTAIAMTFAIYLSLDGFFQPAILNVKSDKSMAKDIRQIVPEGPIYSYVGTGIIRFFLINFYNNDRVDFFEKEMPKEGYLLVGEKDFENFRPRYEKEYTFKQAYRSNKKGCDIRDIVYLYHFQKK